MVQHLRIQLARIVQLRPGEEACLLAAALAFFLILTTNYMLRPVREALTLVVPATAVQDLFGVTFLVLLLLTPVLGFAVNRIRHRRLVPVLYRVITLVMVVFYLLLAAEQTPSLWVIQAYFVWISVFNVLAVALFWGLAADLHRPEEAVRLFGFIAAGGTLGALFGSTLTHLLVSLLGTASMLLVAAACFEGAGLSLRFLLARKAGHPGSPQTAMTGGVLEGARAVLRSPFLAMLSVYLLLYAATSTFLYFLRLELVKDTIIGRDAQVAFFARLDFYVNLLAVFVQLTLTGRILRHLGVTFVLVFVPLVTAAGFLTLGLLPTLSVFVVAYVVRRSAHFAVQKPAQDALWTNQPREARYKAKAFLDTVVYRGGDAVFAQLFGWIRSSASLPVTALLVMPFAIAWALVGLHLGRRAGLRLQGSSA